MEVSETTFQDSFDLSLMFLFAVVLARKSGASEIIQIVTAIMDEKINMALAGLRPDMYYKGQIGDVSRKEGSEGQKEGSEGQK